MFEKKIPPAKLDRYLNDPKLKSRLLVLNIITIALFTAPVVYAAIVASGVVSGEGVSGLGFPIWWILAVISVMQIPAIFILGYLMLKSAESEPTFDAAFQKGQAALIVILALGESVCVFGVVAAVLGGSPMISYGFLGFGVIMMGLGLMVFRPKLVVLAVSKLVEEEKVSG